MNTDSVNPALVRVDSVGLVKTEEDLERERLRESHKQRQTKRAMLAARCAALYAEGNFITAIAEQVSEEYNLEDSIDGEEVRRLINERVAYWRRLGLKHIDDKQALLLAKIDQIEELATNGYFASMSGRATYVFEKQIERAKEQKTQDKKREAAFKKKEEGPSNVLEEELWESTAAPESNEPEFTNGNIEKSLITTAEKIKEYRRYEDMPAGDAKFLAIMLDCQEKRAKIWGLYIRDKAQDNADAGFAAMSDADRQDRLGVILTAAKQRLNPALVHSPSELAPVGPLQKPSRVGNLGEQVKEAQFHDAGMDKLRATREDDHENRP